MRHRTALLALLVALPGEVRAEPAPAAPPASTSLAEVSGTVVALDLQRHRVTVATEGGPLELSWDRNTLIYRPGGATTAAALTPGSALKAGLDPARNAYWIQVRQAPAEPPAGAGRSPAPAGG